MSKRINLPVSAPPARHRRSLPPRVPHRLPLLLQGTGAISQGYAPLDAPIKEHTVSGGGIREQQPIELGDLANDEFFDEVRTRPVHPAGPF